MISALLELTKSMSVTGQAQQSFIGTTMLTFTQKSATKLRHGVI
jgi:hypothetical protein